MLANEPALLLDRVTKGGTGAQPRELKEHLREWLATHDRSAKILRRLTPECSAASTPSKLMS